MKKARGPSCLRACCRTCVLVASFDPPDGSTVLSAHVVRWGIAHRTGIVRGGSIRASHGSGIRRHGAIALSHALIGVGLNRGAVRISGVVPRGRHRAGIGGSWGVGRRVACGQLVATSTVTIVGTYGGVAGAAARCLARSVAAYRTECVVLTAMTAFIAFVAAPAVTNRPSGGLSGGETQHAHAHQGDGKKLFHGIPSCVWGRGARRSHHPNGARTPDVPR
jgi:hypothetical protein